MNNFSNVIAVAFRSILKNKRRNIFTMIGIIIGIAAVITIMSLGNGFKKSTNEQFDEAGAGKDQASISFMTENMEAPKNNPCLLYTSPSPRDGLLSRMPSSA